MSNLKPNLTVDEKDLKALYVHTKNAYQNTSFEQWCKECMESYLNYFNNKKLYDKKQYTYSQWVNAQIISLTTL